MSLCFVLTDHRADMLCGQEGRADKLYDKREKRTSSVDKRDVVEVLLSVLRCQLTY